MRGLIFILLFCCWNDAYSKVLDKIVAVFNDQIITLSQVKRTKSTLRARTKIAPTVFKSANSTLKQLTRLRISQFLMREKLAQVGYVIGDEQVEEQIKNVERKSGFSRKELLAFLKRNRLAFEEYFELIRESIEYNLFVSRVIAPLTSVTEQDVKNTFYKKNLKKNKTLAFKYKLMDFSLEKRLMTKGMLKVFKRTLQNFQTNGILPKRFSKMQTNVLGDVTEEYLTKELKRLLKNTDEGSFTRPILIGDDYHVFLVQKKDLVESELFTKAKGRIKHSLMLKLQANVIQEWMKQEQAKHYIKYFI